MIDRKYPHHAAFLRATELRLDGAKCEIVTIGPGSRLVVNEPNRAFLFHVCSGSVDLRRQGGAPIEVRSGCSLAIEVGAGLDWSVAVQGCPARMFVSSVTRQHAFIRNLAEGMIFIPENEQPFARIVSLVVETVAVELEHFPDDEPVIRRLSEIIMLELIRLIEQKVTALGPAPDTIRHDAHLLKAWTAFFSNPAARWTVDQLAAEAGLSRSAFFERFRRAFRSTPLETLTVLRLDQAKILLRTSRGPLLEIANLAGYKSEAAFIRAFKRRFGTTPGSWRQTDPGA